MVLSDTKYQKITESNVSQEPEKNPIKLAFLYLDPTELRRNEM